MDLIKLKVKTVVLSSQGFCSLLLTDEGEKKVLPITIGFFEAQAIAFPLEGKTPPRPLTHDLLKTICQKLNGELEKVVITDIKDDTYYSEIYLRRNGDIMQIDARPSDAIALALRYDAPIYMAPRLVEFTYDYSDIFKDYEDGDID